MTEHIASYYREGAFVPLNPEETNRLFYEGELVFLKPDRKRYWPRHQWFMALIRDAWVSLPDEKREKYPSPDILRKRLLIASGFSIVRSFVCKTNEDAAKYAEFIAPSLDFYTVISIQDNILVLLTAQSQAIDAMDENTFKESCQAVIEELSKMTGSSIEDIRKHAADIKAKKRAHKYKRRI